MLRTCEQVVSNLSSAITDGRVAPALKISNSPTEVAHYSPEKHEITFSKKFYQLCRSYKADSLNALAAVFAHELAHYYKDHQLLVDFGFSKMPSLANVEGLKEEDLEMVEAEADYFGCFYARIAGYNSLEVLPKVLESIYAEFQIDPQLKGYLPLAERKKMAIDAIEKLKSFIPVFEMGNQLMLMGEYDKASECFAYITRNDFQSREILMNIGVSHLLASLDYLPEGEPKYFFPITFDDQSRLAATKTRGGEFGFGSTREEKFATHLKKAEQFLQLAKTKDPEYYPVLINLSVLHYLQKDNEMAYALALKAKKKAISAYEIANAEIATAMAHIHLGEKVEAEEILKKLSDQGNTAAAGNLRILKGIKEEVPKVDVTLPQQEPISNKYASDMEDVDLSAYKLVEFDGKQIYVREDSQNAYQDMILLHGTKIYRVMSTLGSYTKSTKKGIQLNHKIDAVQKSYGIPDKIIHTPTCNYLIYEKLGLIFQEMDGKVSSWMVYNKS